MSVFQEYRALKKKILALARSYYADDHSIVSDREYDSLYSQLSSMEKNDPSLVTQDSPTQVIGSDKTKSHFEKIAHAVPMLSLENGYTEEEFGDFFYRVSEGEEEVDLVCEGKLDGLSLSLRYERGRLVSAATRGNGFYGEDVLSNVFFVEGVPQELDVVCGASHVEVRGEVVMLKKQFLALNREREKVGLKPFATTRNAAAGSLRQADPLITKERGLRFYAYSVTTLDGRNCYSKQSESLKALANMGFIVSDIRATMNTYEEAIDFYNEISMVREEFPFEIDGLVYKVDKFAEQRRIGVNHKYPKHSLAFKFESAAVEAKIKSIVFQTGRTGVVTPVANLEPVCLGGVEISRATLHNYSEIKRKDIRVGDVVVLERGGDVIPKIVEVVLNKRKRGSEPFLFCSNCPSCGSQLSCCDGEAARRCLNSFNCPAQQIEKIKYFVSGDVFDIQGLGEKKIQDLVDNGYVRSPVDIFYFSKYSDSLKKMRGWGAASVANLKENIERSRHVSLERFILSLGIPKIGAVASHLLAKKFKSCDVFLKHLREKKVDILLATSGVGAACAKDFVQWCSEELNLKFAEELKSQVIVEDQQEKSGVVAGGHVVLTGALKGFTRTQAESLIKKKGGFVTNTVTKRTAYLVVGTSKSISRKMLAAQELLIPIITEAEFVKLYAD